VRNTIVLLSLLLIYGGVRSQASLENETRKRASQFSFQLGTNSYFTQEFNEDQVDRLIPDSRLLMDRSPSLASTEAGNSNTSFYVNLGLQFAHHSRENRIGEFRIALQYQEATVLSQAYSSEETRPFDTLRSSRGGEAVFVDSIFFESLDADLNLDQLALDLSYLYHWVGNSKVSFYTGLGLIAGVSMRSNVQVYSFSSKGEAYRQKEDRFFRLEETNPINEYENHAKGALFFFQAYAPLGMDFRLSRERPFFEQTHLFIETRPGFSVVSSGGLGYIFNPTLQLGIGIRVQLNKT